MDKDRSMNYINKIHINKLFHLQDIDIDIADKHNPHLIITGKNGSGKTVLLNALSDCLDLIKNDKTASFLNFDNIIKSNEKQLEIAKDEHSRLAAQNSINIFRAKQEALDGKVSVLSDRYPEIIEKYQQEEFIIAFYQADRNVLNMEEPKSPTKPKYNKKGKVRDSVTSQFLFFLADLKIQEALARNEQANQDADDIKAWFSDFENLLRQIYQDEKLELKFNYRDYSFIINTEGKSFKLTDTSAGFAAVLDIVADLILKMQKDNSLVRVYDKEGIVLIDEIENHLHLALQKIILPLLTKIFPKIQFIVTTHSPFILSSLNNAVAYDLEHKEKLDNLTDYSYEAIAEGYFGVETQSSYALAQLDKLQTLLAKDNLSDSEREEAKSLKEDFEKINPVLAPNLAGKYNGIKISYSDKLKHL